MNNNTLLREMIAYYEGDPKRIQHFLKVYEFSKLIGECEQLDENTQFLLETTAIVHDIGIKAAEMKYHSTSGKLQEQEGPSIARDLLLSLGYEAETIDRVCYLVGHHHTYTDMVGMDYQILVEADFLVNLYEDHVSLDAVRSAYEKIFVTKTGKELCRTIFGLSYN
jgi:hypothetical protein